MDEKDLVSLWLSRTRPVYERLLYDMLEIAKSMNLPLYVVGGYLRDIAVRRENDGNSDLDIVVEGDAIAYVEVLQTKFGGKIRIHRHFGTANWSIHEIKSRWVSENHPLPDSLDIISSRKERYKHPGALPSVEPGSIADDIDRRDFSINTLALRLDTAAPTLIDRHHAIEDIQNGIIRVIHSESFSDDPTRIFRAVRYEQRYRFKIGKETQNQIKKGLRYINRVSGDRIRNEINHIIEEERIIESLVRLDELGVLDALQPDLSFGELQIKRVKMVLDALDLESHYHEGITQEHRHKMIYAAWFSTLSPEVSRECYRRLNLSVNMRNILEGLFTLQDRKSSLGNRPPIDVVDFLAAIPLLSVRVGLLLEEDPSVKDLLRNFLSRWRNIHPWIKGDDLITMGIPVGPSYSIILRRLRAARLNGIIHTRHEEYVYLEKILAEMKRNDS